MGKKKYYKKPEEKQELPDTPERRAQLVKSYEGQIAYCYKRIAKAQKKIMISCAVSSGQMRT